MTFFFAFINLFVIAWLAYQVWRRQSSPEKAVFWPAWLFKLTAGVCLGWVYIYYYDGVGDTILYFNDSRVLSAFARKHPTEYLAFLWDSHPELDFISDASQPRTLYLLKLASVCNLLTHDNYWITSAYFSFVSFLAAWFLVAQIRHTIPSAYWPAVVGFLFFPTAVFWSSGLIKESLAMAGIYLLGGCYLRLWFALPLRVWEIILVPVAAWVVWSLKYYFLGVLVPIGLASLAVHKLYVMGMRVRNLPMKMLIWIVVMLVPLTLVSWLHPNFQPERLLSVIVDNYRVFHAVSSPEDVIFYHDLRPEWASLLWNAPKAAFAGLFRPMFWEASTGMQWLVSAENAALLLLTIAALWNFRGLSRSPYRLLIVTVLIYAVVLATFLALSTPNFGTLSRYRVGFLSALVTVLLSGNPFVDSLLRFVQRYLGSLAR
ncbi:MAG TPA: hypothetical protein VK658_27995 [Chryseolinea sp.]|nr:hypothetical protein [Chryseolinea sp.]